MKRLILCILSAVLLCGLLLAAAGCSGSETENPEETTAGNPETTTGDNEETTTGDNEETTTGGNEETTTGGNEEGTTGGGEESTTGGNDTEPHVHAFGEWTTVTEATCIAEGQKERVCACGEKEIEKIPETKHNFVNNVCAICGKKEGGGLEYTEDGNGGYKVSGIGTCTDLDIVIPSEYNGKPVTSIGGSAFFCVATLQASQSLTV